MDFLSEHPDLQTLRRTVLVTTGADWLYRKHGFADVPEGVGFSPDGNYVYVGNFIDQDLSILKVDGDKLTDTGQRFKLPGHPASLRAGPQ